MKLYSYYYLIVALLGAFTSQIALGMDSSSKSFSTVEPCSLTSLPFELKARVLAVCNRDIDQEERIAELVKLREVCNAWRAILTDTFIANVVGLPTEPWTLQDCLVLAAQQKKMRTLSLICRVYPWINKQKALNAIGKQCATHFDVLRKLLDLGLNPSAKFVDFSDIAGLHIAAEDDDFYKESILEKILSYDFSANPEAREIFDYLLELQADTTQLGLLEMVTGWLRINNTQHNIYAVNKLLSCSLHPLTDFSQVLEHLCAQECCQVHCQKRYGDQYQLFTNIIDKLVSRGANSAPFVRLPERCARAITEDFNQRLRENKNRFDAFNTQYGKRGRLPVAEYETMLTSFWNIIDEGDTIRAQFNQQTGGNLDLWRPYYMAQGWPQPGARAQHRYIQYKFYGGYLLVFCACYGLYRYWYSQDTSENNEDEESENSVIQQEAIV